MDHSAPSNDPNRVPEWPPEPTGDATQVCSSGTDPHARDHILATMRLPYNDGSAGHPHPQTRRQRVPYPLIDELR